MTQLGWNFAHLTSSNDRGSEYISPSPALAGGLNLEMNICPDLAIERRFRAPIGYALRIGLVAMDFASATAAS